MEEALAPELDLFEPRDTTCSIVSENEEIVYPTYFVPTWPGTTTFNIAPSATMFTRSHIIFKTTFKVMKKKDGKVEQMDGDEDKVAVANNFISTAFSTVQLTVNGMLILMIITYL